MPWQSLACLLFLALVSGTGCSGIGSTTTDYAFSPAEVESAYGEFFSKSGSRVKITSLTEAELMTLANLTSQLEVAQDKKYQGRGYLDLKMKDGSTISIEITREVVRMANGKRVFKNTDAVNQMLDAMLERGEPISEL